MKIAFFTDTFYPEINGVARTLKRFTDYLTTHGHLVKVFAPDNPREEYVPAHIHRFKSASFFLYPECRIAFPNYFKIKGELEKFEPDLIHIATPFNLGMMGVYFAKKMNIPLVGSYHTDFDQYLQFYELTLLSGLLWKYMNWFHRPFEKIFVPSQETMSQLTAHDFQNLEIWPRGVDCELFHPFYDKFAVRMRYSIRTKYILSYAGRLAPEKSVAFLLDIDRNLPSELADKVHWLIVGDGPLRAELEQAAPDNMTFCGYLKGQELAEVYSSSDLFIFPSATETFGNVVLESLASGTPVIGANSGGVKSIIQDGVTGRLCQPHDRQEFTEAIVTLLKKDTKRNQMGYEARNYALTQKWGTIFEDVLSHYHHIATTNHLHTPVKIEA
ncbi:MULTISPECIES: glycosyltransferase family 4 protein [Mesobacillus]|uniref:Glycosyl transferase n=2 Tax=Mesobacillus TaxID=2675231 RepID=A0A0D6Z9K5_9BACI|nr:MULTISPECIES: glycosyltransferase family 1 protein [Mesobacillus]KIY21243.1 glycosyl transferase [Mesobacillus subterraneus]MDQ0415448.1 glycosyltransferase involved in cell wall biosynthesis [Mesobacillus stamsii]